MNLFMHEKVTLEFVTTPQSRYIAVSAQPDFTLEFAFQSLIGSRTKLEDLPKVTHLITSKLRAVFIDHLVHPNFQKIRVPDPFEKKMRRRRNLSMRDGEQSEESEEEE